VDRTVDVFAEAAGELLRELVLEWDAIVRVRVDELDHGIDAAN
jgi:hypothetical protein